MQSVAHLAALALRAALRRRISRTCDADERTKLKTRLEAVKRPNIKTAKYAKREQRRKDSY